MRRKQHFIFVLDTSEHMRGAKIAMLNSTVKTCIEVLRDMLNYKEYAFISVMEFNTIPRWITANGPEKLDENFEIEEMTAGGMCNIGAALKELDSKMSKEKIFCKMSSGDFLPVVIFMTHGWADDNWSDALRQIRGNRWYTKAKKIGFSIGEFANYEEICKIIGHDDVIRIGCEMKFYTCFDEIPFTRGTIENETYRGAEWFSRNPVWDEIDRAEKGDKNSGDSKPASANERPGWPDEDDFV